MKPNHALALTRMKMQKDFTTIGCRFENDEHRGGGYDNTIYTYKVLKSAGVKKGDRVLVIVPNGATRIVKVVRVDRKPQITGTEPWEFKWIVQKIDMREYNKLTRQDASFLRFVQQQETERLLRLSVEYMKSRKK